MTGRVARFVGARRPLEFVELEWPELAAGELLVKMELAAVCGSDLHTWNGIRPEAVPSALGHEGFGTVVRSRREGMAEGAVVTWTLVDSCGQCPACMDHAIPQKCPKLWKYGHGGPGLDGTYATHVKLRAGTAVVEVPADLDRGLAATANCALATSSQASRGLPKPGRAAVLGAGLVGLFGAHLLAEAGFDVQVVETSPERSADAASLGFVATAEAEGAVDLVYEASGAAPSLHGVYPLLRAGGEIRLVGLVHPDSALNLTAEDIVRRCWTVRGSHNYDPRALSEALEAARRFQARFPKGFSLGPVLPLDDVNGAMALAQERRTLRVFVQPDR